jgi:hypothetical protein
MIGTDELIGVWSVGVGYYSTFADDMLVFKPDGSGRLEYWVVELQSTDFFWWRIVSPGLLEFRGERYQTLRPRPNGLVERSSTLQFPAVRFRVQEEERPRGTSKRMPVLRIELPTPFPNELGLLSRDPDYWANRAAGGNP